MSETKIDTLYDLCREKNITPIFNHVSTKTMSAVGADPESRGIFDKTAVTLLPWGVQKVKQLTSLKISLDLFCDPGSNVFKTYYCSNAIVSERVDGFNLRHDAFYHLQRYPLCDVTWIFPDPFLLGQTVKFLKKASFEVGAKALLVAPDHSIPWIVQTLANLVGSEPKIWSLVRPKKDNVLSVKTVFGYKIILLSAPKA